MASRLTDKQKKMIIATYAEIGSYRAVAKKCGVAAVTVKRIIENDAEFAQKVARKKEKNSQEVLAYMEGRKNDACTVIDKCLTALADDDKIALAPLVQIATAMGIVIDKFTANEVRTGDKTIIDAFIRAIKPTQADMQALYKEDSE